MKRISKVSKIILFITLVVMTLSLCATALGDAPASVNVPSDVNKYLSSSRWSGWEVTGWVNPGEQKTSNACAFLSVKNGSTNQLLAFGWKDGAWVYKWYNPSVLPQVKEPVVLGQIQREGTHFTSYYLCEDGTQEMFCLWEQQRSGSWTLQELQHAGHYRAKAPMHFDTHKDGVMTLSNTMWKTKGSAINKRVYGVYQRDLRYFTLSAFPLTLKEAKASLSNPPEIPYGDFSAQVIKFTSGKKYPVYTGPGENYFRSAGGKATVSTNDWIQVFGRFGEWIMVQYDITSDQMRIGFIKASALPKKANVADLTTVLQPRPVTIVKNTFLTDEPIEGQSPLVSIPAGQGGCAYMGALGEEWAYLQVTINNQQYWGFVPSSDIQLEPAVPGVG